MKRLMSPRPSPSVCVYQVHQRCPVRSRAHGPPCLPQHDSDSEGDYGNESTSSPNAALVRSASGSNLMSAASRLSGSAPNGQAASDEAIDGTRLRPSEARHKFVKSRTLVSSSEAG